MSGSTAWEVVSDTPYDKIERLAVDGGWLYRNMTVVSSSAQDAAHYLWGVSITFVPTPAAPMQAAHHGKHE